jgi:predicted  nucleic acid-binding Zn-ribbon protein
LRLPCKLLTFLQTYAQHYEAIEASEGRMREQMNALQRKLVRVVTENEALRHVVDKLQCNVLSLRRQLQRAGMALDAELDEALLRPSPHQVQPAAESVESLLLSA